MYLRVAASQHFGYKHLKSQARVRGLSIPLEPMDLYGLKMCMRETNKSKYQSSIEEAWQDMCITHAGGIARVAVMAFDQMERVKTQSTSQMEEEIRCLAINCFKEKVRNHFKTKLEDILQTTAINLERNLVETRGDYRPDEAVYMSTRNLSAKLRERRTI